MRIVDLNYCCHEPSVSPQAAWDQHYPAIGYADHFKPFGEVFLIKHFQSLKEKQVNGKRISLPGSAGKWWIPREAHRLVNFLEPDIVIVQGLIFPFQLWLLRMSLPKRVRILVQHHGEQPPSWWSLITGIANRQANAFLFTAAANAEEWKRKKLIPANAQVYQLLEASTTCTPVERNHARAATGVIGGPSMLWVGRLNRNKDPLTLLRAFAQFVTHRPAARLYMIFQTNELLPEINAFLETHKTISDAIILVGQVAKDEMSSWYSSVDLFVSTSRREGSGYSLIESLACGCIPIVSDIPSFNAITAEGAVGFFFPPGDADKLAVCMSAAIKVELEKARQASLDHFERALSFEAIARSLAAICNEVKNR